MLCSARHARRTVMQLGFVGVRTIEPALFAPELPTIAEGVAVGHRFERSSEICEGMC